MAELFTHIKQPQFVYHHSWRKNDVLIWDNPSTQHNAVKNYGPSELRLMHRVMTKFQNWVPAEVIPAAA